MASLKNYLKNSTGTYMYNYKFKSNQNILNIYQENVCSQISKTKHLKTEITEAELIIKVGLPLPSYIRVTVLTWDIEFVSFLCEELQILLT